MRRVIAISLAILVLAVGARGVMAQESDQAVSDRLLEILKDRQIISDDEFSELKDLAATMEQNRGDMDARIDAIDRSISEYLAEGGDARGANVTHKKGKGFGFSTGDGFFSLWLGGLFQTWYTGQDNEDARDTNSIAVRQNRFQFVGNAFDPNFTYKFQFNVTSGAVLLDAYGNWDIMNGLQARFGQFKVPFGRQELASVGELQFASRSPISNTFVPGRDVGVMVWDTVPMEEGGEPMFDWYAGLFNGDGAGAPANDNNWMAVALRGSVHPLGYIPYSEGDFEQSEFKFAAGGSYYYTNNRPFGQTVKSDNWNLDAVAVYNGLYFVWEYFYNNTNPRGANRLTSWASYAQVGYMIPNSQFEVMGRYGFASWDGDTGLDETNEWAVGFAYYFDGHPFKVVVFVAQMDTDIKKEYQGIISPGDPVNPFEWGLSSFGGGSSYDYSYVTAGKTTTLNVAFQLDW